MPHSLMSFLVELAVSPERLAVYEANPDEAIKEAGLNAEECLALKSKDPAKVWASLFAHVASPKHPVGPTIYGRPVQADAVCIALPPDCVVVPPVCIAIRLAEAVCVVQPQAHHVYEYYFAPQAPPSEPGPGKTH